MQEFPAEDVLGFLIALEVANVIFQPYSIDIGFTDGTYLVCEHKIEYVGEDGASHQIDIQKRRLGPVCLHEFVGRHIEGIVRDSFLLTLRFNGDWMLKIYSIPGPLESGHFSHAGEVIVF